MAITYPRTLPTSPGIKSNRFGLVYNVDELISPVTMQLNTDEKSGHHWEGMFVYPSMLPVIAAEWKAWFATMQGSIKTFLTGDPDHTTPFGIADIGSDTPIVNGASQTGRTVITSGWRNNGVNLLAVGDYFHIGTELKQAVESLGSGGTGAATISFEPPFHVPPANGAAIVFENPVGLCRLERLSVPWESDKFGKTDFAFAFVESF